MNFQTLSILAAALVSQSGAHYAPNSCTTFHNGLVANAANIDDLYKAVVEGDVDATCVANVFLRAPSVETIQSKYPKILDYAIKRKVLLNIISAANFEKLKPDYFVKFIKSDPAAQCAALSAQKLIMAMKNKHRAAAITPECFASIPGTELNQAVPKENVKRLPKKVFQDVDETLHDSYFEGMTKEQVKYFQSNKVFEHGVDRCAQLKVRLLPKKVFAEITPACWQSWLVLNPAHAHPIPADRIKNLSASHLKKAEMAAVASLVNSFQLQANGKSAWLKAKDEVVQVLASNQAYAQYLPAAAVGKNLKVDPHAFARMNSPAKGAILHSVASLPDDIFKHVSDADMRAIKYTDPKGDNKKECEGFDCLYKIDKHANIDKMMEDLNEYICITRKFNDFRKRKGDKDNLYIVGKHMSRDCFKNLDVTYELVRDNANDVHENMLRYVSVDIAEKVLENKEWLTFAENYVENKKKNRAFVGFMLNPKIYARLLKLKHFDKLNKKGFKGAMDAFCSEGLRVFPEFEKLNADYIAAIGDQIYSAFTKVDASKIDYSKSSHVQIGNASARVQNPADHYATTLTADSVKLIAPEVFPLMNEGYFISMTEDAYSGISKEQFDGAPPAKLTKVTAAQFSKMADAVKKGITPEQITFIGNHGGPRSESEMAMLEALGAVAGSFNEFQSTAYKARLALSSGAMGSAGASLMALAASLALIFPLL